MGRILQLPKEVQVIVSVAHASMEDAESTHMYGIWSDFVVGETPEGLVDCFLLRGDGSVHVHAIWENREAHDQAVEQRSIHPALGFFDACGLDPTHTVYEVIGRMG